MSKDESSIRIMAGTAAIHDGRPRRQGERCDTFAGITEDGRDLYSRRDSIVVHLGRLAWHAVPEIGAAATATGGLRQDLSTYVAALGRGIGWAWEPQVNVAQERWLRQVMPTGEGSSPPGRGACPEPGRAPRGLLSWLTVLREKPALIRVRGSPRTRTGSCT
ncbi:T3SS effector HopA1 family protein [Streptosporangium sp. NPDC005286]|uniref:T3SS effector HopA1 family protein n=1 Tax=Streptosporangium sp. NPDC005286 TaxID=3154463 RepID=UPI0033BD90F7